MVLRWGIFLKPKAPNPPKGGVYRLGLGLSILAGGIGPFAGFLLIFTL